MTKSTEEQPAAVSAKTKRAGEILPLILQVEPKVWTERMLTALVQRGQRRQVVQPDRQGTTLERTLTSRVHSSRCRTGEPPELTTFTISMFRSASGRGAVEALQRTIAERTSVRRRSADTTSPRRARPTRPGRWGCRSVVHTAPLCNGVGECEQEVWPFPGPCGVHETERRVLERCVGLRKRATTSGVNRIHQGP